MFYRVNFTLSLALKPVRFYVHLLGSPSSDGISLPLTLYPRLKLPPERCKSGDFVNRPSCRQQLHARTCV